MTPPYRQLCTTHLRMISALCSLAMFVGCSHQDFSTPVRNPLSAKRALPAETVANEGLVHAERRMEQLMSALVSLESLEDREEDGYRVGPGDKLAFSIRDLESPGESSELERDVMGDGQLSLPWIGEIDAQGLTLDELQDKVIEGYRDDYIKNPEVNIRIVSYENVEVLVTGAVRKPGVYHLEKNQTTLIELLATVGGMNEDASDEVLVIRNRQRKSEKPTAKDVVDDSPKPADVMSPDVLEAEMSEPTMRASIEMDAASSDQVKADDVVADAMRNAGVIVPIDLKELLDRGDMSLNLSIGDGDIVNVRPKSRRFVYVLGYVNRPGSFEMPPGRELDPVRAVALAGGLASSARAQNSFVVRETTEGQQIIKVNLVKAARGEEESFSLASGDTLVIGSSTMGRLAEFVKPSAGAGVDAVYTPGL